MTEKLEAPNHTQIPNAILGDIAKGNKVIPGLMASLEGSELKVLLAVCRLTFGFHQTSRRASLTMIEQLTGLSRQGVVNAAAALTNKGLIEREYDGGVTLWKVVVNSVDYPDINELVNSVDQVVNSVDQTSQLSRPPSKKETRKKPEKETSTTTGAEKLTDFYLTYISTGKVSQMAVDLINNLLESYSEVDISYAIEQAVKNSTAENNKCTLAYIEAVCKRRQSGQPDKKPRPVSTNGHKPKIAPQPIPTDTDFYRRWNERSEQDAD